MSNYSKNQKVFSQRDPADAVFYIQDGKVKVSVQSERGKEAVVALHGKGDFFGEGCLTGQPLRLATAATMTDCVISRLEKAAILRVLNDEPKFGDGRYDPVACERIYEQIPQAWVHRVQWGPASAQLPAQRRAP